MGGYLSKRCPCKCDSTSIATYRCRMAIRKDFPYSPKMLDSTIDDDESYNDIQKYIFKELKKYHEYHFSQCHNGITTWIACKKCITLNVIPFFTFHPNGWLYVETNKRTIYDYEYNKI